MDQHASALGSTFDIAIRAVGFDLISAVGSAEKDAGLQGLLVDRINFEEKESLVLLGVIVDGKFERLNVNGPNPNAAVQKFIDALSTKRVLCKLEGGQAGVEMQLAD